MPTLLLLQIFTFLLTFSAGKHDSQLLYGVLDIRSGLFISQVQQRYFHVAPMGQLHSFCETKLAENTDSQTSCSEQNQRLKPHETRFYIWIVISVCLTLFAGLMSGLTVGYLSINDLNLEIKIKSGTQKEVKAAKRVLPILQQHHWLLVTLLLANAAAMEALPIFLDALVPAYAAVIISVTAVLIFGEIIPQAVCTGPSQIQIAAAVAPVTRILMWLLSPLSYPISLMLDCCLGRHHKPRFQNKELKELVHLHSKQELQNEKLNQAKDCILEQSQTHLIMKAIDLNKDTVAEVMKKCSQMVALSSLAPFTHETIAFIEQSGFSRIPIFEADNSSLIVSVLLSKVLLTQPPSQDLLLSNLKANFVRPLVVKPTAKLMEVLHKFQQGFCHFAVVTEQVDELELAMNAFEDGQQINIEEELNKSDKTTSTSNNDSEEESKRKIDILGFFTMADILEHIFQIEIYDETDLNGMTQRRSIHQGQYRRVSDLEIEEQRSESKSYRRWESKLKPIGQDLDESLLSLEGFGMASPNLPESEEYAMADMSPRKNRKSIRRGLVAVSGQPPQVDFLAPHPISQERMKSEFNL